MTLLESLRTLAPEHKRLAANLPFLTIEESDKLDRMNAVIRAASIRLKCLTAVRDALRA